MNRLLFCGFLALSIAQPAQAMVKPYTKSKTATKTARAPAKANVAPAEKFATAALPSSLSPEQLAIAEKVYLGKIPCELGAHVTMKADQRATGRFLLEAGQKRLYHDPGGHQYWSGTPGRCSVRGGLGTDSQQVHADEPKAGQTPRR